MMMYHFNEMATLNVSVLPTQLMKQITKFFSNVLCLRL